MAQNSFRIAEIFSMRMVGVADGLNTNTALEHKYRNRKIRGKHVELLRFAHINGVLTRVVMVHIHPQKLANRHIVLAESTWPG